MVMNWLLGKRNTHPMANRAKAEEMIAGLSITDPVRALEDATHWLDSISRNDKFTPRQRFELIGMIDRAGKNHWQKLAPEYLDAQRLRKMYENRLWQTFFGYWKVLGDSYVSCLRQYQARASGAQKLEKDIVVVVGRAIRSLAVQIKWRLLRYEMIEQEIWRELADIYLFAESHGFATKRSLIYPGKHGESTPQEELLKAMLLAVSSPDGLTPPKIQIAERIVALVSHKVTLTTEAASSGGFFFDLSMHAAPGRYVQSMDSGALVRYFSPASAITMLRGIVRAVQLKGALPDDINLGGNFDTPTVIVVISHLARHWSDKPPARRHVRRRSLNRLTVVPGFADALAWIESASDQDSLEFVMPQSAESWVVSDISEGGFGATIPALSGDWVRIGTLLGVRAENTHICRVGVIRRSTRDKADRRKVGMETLSPVAIPARVSAVNGAGSVASLDGPVNALLLSTKPDAQGQIDMVLAPGFYRRGVGCGVCVQGKKFIIAPVRKLEEDENYIWARFKVVKPL